MRSQDETNISGLAKQIYDWIFAKGEPPPHILLRDYARGVIEISLSREYHLELDMEKVRPPYKSEWSPDVPSKQELEKYGETRKDMPDEELG